MKKRILLSLVSFFMMTAMWASLLEAYQIYVTAANGKTYSTAELTLNMKNQHAIATWTCELVLPAGVTFQSVAIVDGRYPEGYNAEISAIPSNDNSVKISCSGVEGLTLTGTDGAVAVVTVDIAGDAPLGDCQVLVKDIKLVEPNDDIHERESTEFTWTIEEGTSPVIPGDANGDGKIDAGDVQTVLIGIANFNDDPVYDANKDGKVDAGDVQTILIMIANQS